MALLKTFENAAADFKKYYHIESRGYKTECWVWNSPDFYRGGYGRIWFSNNGMSAHRFSWLIHKGKIQKGIEVCHKCDVKECVNPGHLFLGTHLENIRDAYSKNLIRNLRGVEQKSAKLDDEKVRMIRLNYKRGIRTYKFFADLFGVDQALIHRIVKRKSWAHVK
jgi:hypothetical protein